MTTRTNALKRSTKAVSTKAVSRTHLPLTTFILTTIIALAMMPGCTNDTHDEPLEPTTAITLIIPETLPLTKGESRATWPTPGASGQWEDGDQLYINIVYWDNSNDIGTLNLIARRHAAQWVFSNNIIPPKEAVKINITAKYTVAYDAKDASLNQLVLQSNDSYPLSADTVKLKAFEHMSTRITFTGLATGSKLSFKDDSSIDHPWCIGSVNYDDYATTTKNIPTFIANDSDSVEVYVNTYQEGKDLCFRVDNQPNAEWYTFNPGASPKANSDYRGQHYTIDYSKLQGGGYMEAQAELERFLAWADECRGVTGIGVDINKDFTLAHDIDLSSIANWVPIGTNMNSYVGAFDGGGHTITGLTVNTNGRAGLFGFAVDATIKNLTIRGARITTTGAGMPAGAIVGQYDGIFSFVIACRAIDCTVKGEEKIGGIAGDITGTTLLACHTKGGSITATGKYVGGIAGYNINGDISFCIGEAETITGSVQGALVGYSDGEINLSGWRAYDTGEGIGNTPTGFDSGSYGGTPFELTDAGIRGTELMNEYIANHNTTAAAHQRCDYIWTTNGLVKQP